MQMRWPPRFFDRLATSLSLGMLGALALFSIYLAQMAERERQRPPAAAPGPQEADYFVDRLSLLTLTPSGDPHWRIQAAGLRHFPSDDSARFERLTLVSLNPQQPMARLQADTGRWLRARPPRETTVELQGNVLLVRAAHLGQPEWRMRTERALILPDSEQVHSGSPVRVTDGVRELSATGFALDLRERTLRLDSEVRATWRPPQAP
jgi:lipopolysaccharide export system protein LptC